MDCCYMSSKNLSKNQKRHEFFGFFALLQVRFPSKNQKNLQFFVFSRSWPKKTKKTRGKPKKNKHEPQTKHSLKSFGFLVFSRFRRTSQPFDFSLGERPWGKTKNLDKTKKPKNQNFSENVWSEAHVCSFLVFLEFFLFFLVMTLKKLKKLKVFLVFWINWWLKDLWKTKKTQVFFGFLHGLLLHVF